MKIIALYSSLGNWDALYVDDSLYMQAEKISHKVAFEIVGGKDKYYDVKATFSVEEFEVCGEYIEKMGGTLPLKLSDIPNEVLKNGV